MRAKLPLALRPIWRVWVGRGGNNPLRLKFKDLRKKDAQLLMRRFRKAGLDVWLGRDWRK